MLDRIQKQSANLECKDLIAWSDDDLDAEKEPSFDLGESFKSDVRC